MGKTGCDFVAEGTTKQEVKDKMLGHHMTAHDEDSGVPEDQMDKRMEDAIEQT